MDNTVTSSRIEDCKSILEGVERFLPPYSFTVEAAINQIEANWSGKKSRSVQNWRLEPIPLAPDSGYTNRDWRTSEVLQERLICEECRQKQHLIWNQMPTASGLLSLPPKREDGKRRVASEGRRAIDLVFQPNGAEAIYEFLELKILRQDGSADTLLHATREVLEYGLLYLFSRKHRVALGYEKPVDERRYAVLEAREIHLRVLADARYYEGNGDSEVAVDAINQALDAYLDQNRSIYGALKMNFGFQELGKANTPCEAFIGKRDWPAD